MPKAIERKYHLFDAKGKILGRMSTEAALILRGKNKVDFTPNVDGGDFVVVVNSDRVAVTGKKMDDKIYHRFSGYPGGITSVKLKEQMIKDSRKVIEHSVYHMLAKNKLRNRMMTRLLIYKDEKHKHKIDVTH
jgi:large subunit ribosomal protein L13